MDRERRIRHPERARTDDSLSAERDSSDRSVAANRLTIEKNADEVVVHARELADALLGAARGKADRELDPVSLGRHGRAVIATGRATEDRVLQDERNVADEVLSDERRHIDRTLASLLPLERERTDRDLLTERSRADAKLSNRDEFLGMVTHDLRNLLCGVLLEASRLSDLASDSIEGRRTVAGVQRLERYVARLNGLIGDLVDVVSIDSGKLAVRRIPCDVDALLAEAVDTFALAAEEKGIALGCEVSTGDLAGDLDHGRILQVLANLITNAIKFTPRGGAIRIHGERIGSELRLSVRDTGSGIPAHLLEAVFQRYWQVERDRRGLGLGLYISKCIVGAHGGKLWAESEMGDGSSFFLTIPDLAAA